MMHSPIMRILMMASWAITSIASANFLFILYGYDIFGYMTSVVPGMASSLPWIIGIAGIYSLVMFVMMLTRCGSACGCGATKCSRCGCSPCVCK